MATDETLRILTELGQQVSRLTKRVEELESENSELKAENTELKAENKELRELLHHQGQTKASKAPKFSKDYSVER